ncbi:MAG: hypothetical protein ACM3VW_02990 [Bacteroidota bacterium]
MKTIKQRRSIAFGVVLMTLVAGACLSAASAQEPVCLRYAPAQGQQWNEKLTGEVVDVAVQGQSLGVTGLATADIVAEISALDAAKKTASLKLTSSNIAACLNGQNSRPAAPQPMVLQVDQTGKMTMNGAQAEGAVNFMETGGVPLQIINILVHNIRFSADPVKKDDEWTAEDSYAFPGMATVPLNTRWKLMGQEGDKVTICSTAVATMPDFKAPNPMVPGTEMDVKGATVTITEMKQEYDTKLSRVLKTQGTLSIQAKVDMQGMQLPLVLALKFKLDPAAAAKEPPR